MPFPQKYDGTVKNALTIDEPLENTSGSEPRAKYGKIMTV